MDGILAQKIGMTRLFTDEGMAIPVTVLKAEPTVVVEVRTAEKNQYQAVVGASFDVKDKHLTKSELGYFQKNKVKPSRFVQEFAYDQAVEPKIGDTWDVSIFENEKQIKVTGYSKGRGFAGTIKRYGFSRGPMTHGSHNKRAPGSIGACSSPSRVFPGQKMPGHYGDAKTTVKNLKVFKVDKEKNLLFVKGAVPGAKEGMVTIQKM